MPFSDSTSAPGLDPSSRQTAPGSWLGWSPRAVGGLTLLLFAVPMLATIWNMYQRADQILQHSIQRQLLASARSISMSVDGELYKSFKSPSQELSAAYLNQIREMENVKMALDTDGMIKFVYACSEVDGHIRFVLDTTAPGDADGDGKDDKAHIMEIYESPSASLVSALRTGTATVDQTPYQDRWGTFMSAYAPIFDTQHRVVGVAGVDMALTDYDLQRSSVYHLALISAIGIVCMSYIAALGVAAYHRRLQRSVKQLVVASEAATVAARTKVDFLASMSHELRTPLNAVIGMSELLQDSPLDASQQSLVGTIQKSGESLLNTLTDILDFCHLDEGNIKTEHIPVSLRAMLQEQRSSFQAELASKRLSFDLTVALECPKRFLGDPNHLRQILRHLITNAIKFTDAGQISVEVMPDTLPSGEQGLHFLVKDTGIGIPTQQIRDLFMPFFQVDASTTRRHGGTGIGLAICKRLCDAMSGQIFVESEVGTGTVFHVIIPAPPLEELAETSTETEVILWSQDTMTQMLVKHVVEKQGLGIRIARTEEALQNFLSSHLSGWVFVDASLASQAEIDRLKKNAPGARIVILNSEPGWQTQVPVEAILPQPVRPADLRQLIEA